MGFKEKLSKHYTESYFNKYGDRITQVQGNVISIKVERKTILWIFHKLKAIIVVRPERSKNIVKCYYKKNKWFKKPDFITVSQGNLIQVYGLKGKKGKEDRETISLLNIRNLSTKKDLVPIDGVKVPKRVQKTLR